MLLVVSLYYLQIRMNGQEMFIGNKKKIACDEETVSKKANRNLQKKLNKTVNTTKMISEIQVKKNVQKQQNKQKASLKGTMNGLTEKQLKKIEDIKSVLINHKQETIRRVLQKHQYDKNQAMEELFTLPEDQQQNGSVEGLTKEQQGPIGQFGSETGKVPKKKKHLKEQNQSKQQIGNQILNQMYDHQQEIDPSQFEQLFEEIARIIKEQQKIQGMDVFQINEFIDNCYLIKNVILQDQSDIYVDEDNEIYLKTEIFLEEIIKNRVAQENKRKEDFPTLGAVNKDTSSNKGYIQKIQDQYKVEKQKQDYFTPSKVPQIQYHPQNNYHEYSLYSVNNDPKSHADIVQLSKEYNDMGIDNLKFIYLRLQDINLCKQFLDRFYPGKKMEIKIEKKEEKKSSSSNTNAYKKIVPQAKYKRIQDDNYNKYSLQQIRDQLDHLFKLRSVFRMTRGRITNVAQRKQLQRLACRQNPRIKKLSQVARYKVLERMVETNPQYIDLHGYREEEIEDLFDDIEDMIRTEFNKGNSNLKPTKIGNKVYCVVQALTGKGLHSKYNKSVLKPALLDWCNRAGVQAIETDDSINIHFVVR